MPTELQPRANNTKLIIFFTIALSLTISSLYISATHVLSPDSLLYIFTAQTFIDHGLQAAVEAYRWPLLSLVIAGMHQPTGLSLVLSGHILIASLYAGLSCAFVLLVRDLGGSTRSQLLALLIRKTKFQHPELLAIRLKHKEADQLREIESLAASEDWTLTKTFSNEQGDRVLILSHQPQINGSRQ